MKLIKSFKLFESEEDYSKNRHDPMAGMNDEEDDEEEDYSKYDWKNGLVEYTSNAIAYTWELAGSEGASFILYPNKDHTQKQIADAKRELRNQRDVVHMKIASEEDRDYLYKSAIFRVPSTSKLKWYEIEQDEKIIRQERLKGTSPLEYVKKIVRPNIKKTTEDMIKKFGEKILQK